MLKILAVTLLYRRLQVQFHALNGLEVLLESANASDMNTCILISMNGSGKLMSNSSSV